MKEKVTQLCQTLCNPMYYTLLRILQARILEWASFPFSRGSSQPRGRTQSPTLQVDCFPAEPLRINQGSICIFEELGGWGGGLSWWKLWRGTVAWKKVSERKCFLQVWWEGQFLNTPQGRKVVCCLISAAPCEFRFPKKQTTRRDQRIRH